MSKCDVFEGARVVYRGVRCERAWSWVWQADLPDRHRVPVTSGAASGLVERIHVLIAQSNLSQYDKKQCRRSVSSMSAEQLRRLETSLRGY